MSQGHRFTQSTYLVETTLAFDGVLDIKATCRPWASKQNTSEGDYCSTTILSIIQPLGTLVRLACGALRLSRSVEPAAGVY